MIKRFTGSSALNKALLNEATSLLEPILTSSWSLLRPRSDGHLLCTEAKPSTNWVFLGPPGVGKGTYSTRAAEALGLKHISTGDLIRAEVKSQSELGKQVG